MLERTELTQNLTKDKIKQMQVLLCPQRFPILHLFDFGFLHSNYNIGKRFDFGVFGFRQ